MFVIRDAYQRCWELFRSGKIAFVCIARAYVMSTPTHTVEERVFEQSVCHGDLDIAVLVASDSQI